MKTTKERGLFKQRIKQMLFKSDNIIKMLIPNAAELSAKDKLEEFEKCVKSHLFINDTLTEKGTYIFFDVLIPDVSAQTKECRIVIYLVCHRDLLDDGYSVDGYCGNRADILSQMVEEALLNEENANQFGIGELQLLSVDLYNSTNYYGVEMLYSAECFR